MQLQFLLLGELVYKCVRSLSRTYIWNVSCVGTWSRALRLRGKPSPTGPYTIRILPMNTQHHLGQWSWNEIGLIGVGVWNE